jgi:hypothetical protein
LAHELLPIQECFALATVSDECEACAFRPRELSNMNRGAGYALTLQDFTFHDTDCFTPKGSGFGIPNPDGSRDRWTWKAVTFARQDVLRVWADWPAFSAWKLARTHAWQPPRGISADWLKNLAPGQYVSLSDAVDLLVLIEPTWCAGWGFELKALFAAYVEAMQRRNQHVLKGADGQWSWPSWRNRRLLRSHSGRRVSKYKPAPGLDPCRFRFVAPSTTGLFSLASVHYLRPPSFWLEHGRRRRS